MLEFHVSAIIQHVFSLAKHSVSEIHHVFVVICFFSLAVFHYVDMSGIIYIFISCWSFGLFPVLGRYKFHKCHEASYTGICVDMFLFLSCRFLELLGHVLSVWLT